MMGALGKCPAYLSRVDGHAIVLVVDGGVGDGDPSGGSDVEAVRVGTLVIAILAVNVDAAHRQRLAVVDTEDLHGRVEDRDVLDGGVSQVVSLEELGLGLSTAAAFSVPVVGTVAVQDGAASTLHRD
jgi:hypothetical protein